MGSPVWCNGRYRMVQWKGSTGTCPFSLRTSKEARLFPGFFACRKSQFSIQKVFGRLFEKGGRVEGRRPSSPSAEGERPDSPKDQEGRRNSPVGCCVVGNPIKGFPDAASHAAFVPLAICQPVFDTLKRPGNSRASCHAVNILLCPQSRAADINGAGAQLSLHTGSQPMASITRRTTALTTYS